MSEETKYPDAVEEIMKKLPWRIYPSGGRHEVLAKSSVQQALITMYEKGREDVLKEIEEFAIQHKASFDTMAYVDHVLTALKNT